MGCDGVLGVCVYAMSTGLVSVKVLREQGICGLRSERARKRDAVGRMRGWGGCAMRNETKGDWGD